MRGEQNNQIEVFSYIPLESRIPKDHPLRPIREMVDRILKNLSGEFDRLYSHTGRPGVPPEQLLKALTLQVLFSIRSERQLVENIRYNLLYRWFVGLAPDDCVWDHTVFTKNRERLFNDEVAAIFFQHVLQEARKKKLISNDHFTVDGTLIEAWASLKSFRPKDEDDNEKPEGGNRNPDVNYHGKKRKNKTHESKTDPESRLYTKGRGQEAKLFYMGHVLMENRNGLAVDCETTEATGVAERESGTSMIIGRAGSKRKTLGADKGYSTGDFIDEVRELNFTPHFAKRNNKKSVDSRTSRHEGYEISQRRRKRVEEIFGWLKTIGNMRKSHYRGKRKVSAMFTFALSVYNLLRIRNLCYA
jgi:transposase